MSDETPDIDRPKHDCPSIYPFNKFLKDRRVPFYYRDDLDAWGIPTVIDETFPDEWWNDAPFHQATYCPWCGQALPKKQR